MNIIETTQALIDKPYAEKTDLSWQVSISTHCNNFFRNNPCRKIILLNDDTGDYEQDEEMTQEKELEMEAENDVVYKNAQAILFDYLKKFARTEDTQPSNMATRYDFEDDAKEDTMIEGENTEWTPEYEGGIADFDFDKNTIWDLGNEYLYLGCVKDCGDGNFGYYTFICITRKTEAESNFKPQLLPTVEAYFSYKAEIEKYVFAPNTDIQYDPKEVTFCRLEQGSDFKILPKYFFEAINLNKINFEFSSYLEKFPDLSSLKNLSELEVISTNYWDEFEDAKPESLQQMVLQPLKTLDSLTINKFKQLPLSFLLGISKWENLKTLILYEVDIIFDEDDFNNFIQEINNSKIENIKIPGTDGLLYLEDESKELQDYLPNKKVSFQY